MFYYSHVQGKQQVAPTVKLLVILISSSALISFPFLQNLPVQLDTSVYSIVTYAHTHKVDPHCNSHHDPTPTYQSNGIYRAWSSFLPALRHIVHYQPVTLASAVQIFPLVWNGQSIQQMERSTPHVEKCMCVCDFVGAAMMDPKEVRDC